LTRGGGLKGEKLPFPSKKKGVPLGTGRGTKKSSSEGKKGPLDRENQGAGDYRLVEEVVILASKKDDPFKRSPLSEKKGKARLLTKGG